MSVVAGIIMALCLCIAWYIGAQYKYDKISFKDSIDLLELPVITFTNNNVKLNFLLDTGANRSILSEEYLKLCAFSTTNKVNTLAGLDGIERRVDNVVINLVHDNKSYECVVQVTDMSSIFGTMKKESGVNIHGILGNDFFTKYKYILDFQSMVAYSKKSYDIFS